MGSSANNDPAEAGHGTGYAAGAPSAVGGSTGGTPIGGAGAGAPFGGSPQDDDTAGEGGNLNAGGSGGELAQGGAGGDSMWGAAGASGADECKITQQATIEIRGRRDLVFDDHHCKLYVSTDSGTVYTYDLSSGTLSPLVELGTPLLGLDLSPGGSTLVVADADASPYASDRRNQVHLINVETKATRTYSFPLESLEAGTWMPLFIDRGHFLLTSSFAGTGWVPLRRVSLASGSFETLQLVGQSTTLALSADGSAVGMALPNDSGGNFVRLDLSDGSTLKGNTYKYMREVAISRDGTELAFPVWDGVLVYQFAGEFGEPRTLKIESPRHGLGAVYSRVKDVLYVASAEVGGDDASAIEAFNAKTLEWISMLDDGPGLDWVTAAQGAMGIGRMRISRDGKMLGVTVDEGVKIYPLP